MSLGASELRDDDVAGLRFFRRTRIVSAVPIGFFGHGLGRADQVGPRWKESHRQCASDDAAAADHEHRKFHIFFG